MPASTAEMTYRTMITCQARAPGQPRGDGVVADRVEQASIAGPSEPEQDQQRQRHEHDEAVGDDRQAGSIRSCGARAGRLRLSGPLDLPDVGEAQHDQAHAEGHDQRVHLEHADADAVHERRQPPRSMSTMTIATGSPMPDTNVATTNPASRRRTDGQVDAHRSASPASGIRPGWRAARRRGRRRPPRRGSSSLGRARGG